MLTRQPIVATCGYLGGVPALYEGFVWSWSQMIQYNAEFLCKPGERVHYERATVSYHAVARNWLVTQMKGDWLLQVDCDIAFEPDLLERMLASARKYDVQVLTGLYVYKSPPHQPVLYVWDRGRKGFVSVVDWDKDDVNLIGEVSSGAGCLLVHREVYDAILTELHEQPFDISPGYSEDHSFFLRLRRLGITAYCDPNIQVYHLGVKAYSMDDFDPSEIEVIGSQTVRAQ